MHLLKTLFHASPERVQTPLVLISDGLISDGLLIDVPQDVAAPERVQPAEDVAAPERVELPQDVAAAEAVQAAAAQHVAAPQAVQGAVGRAGVGEGGEGGCGNDEAQVLAWGGVHYGGTKVLLTDLGI